MTDLQLIGETGQAPPKFKKCLVVQHNQGRNEARWRPGNEASLAPHVRSWAYSKVNLLYWRSTNDIVWTFLRSRNDSAPGELCPLTLLVTLRPWVNHSLQSFSPPRK